MVLGRFITIFRVGTTTPPKKNPTKFLRQFHINIYILFPVVEFLSVATPEASSVEFPKENTKPFNIRWIRTCLQPYYPHIVRGKLSIIRWYTKIYKTQGSKGKRQWLMNWCTSPMMIHKITPDVVYNQWLKHWDT